MIVHLARTVAKRVKGSQPKPAPMRLARGVVVTSQIGTSRVMIDGETDPTNAVLVNNLAHVSSLAPGAVIEVWFTGNTGTIVGQYP